MELLRTIQIINKHKNISNKEKRDLTLKVIHKNTDYRNNNATLSYWKRWNNQKNQRAKKDKEIHQHLSKKQLRNSQKFAKLLTHSNTTLPNNHDRNVARKWGILN